MKTTAERFLSTTRVSHTRPPERPPLRTVADLLQDGTRRLAKARLHYGHGSDNPGDDAAALVFHVLGLEGELDAATLAWQPGLRAQCQIQALIARRIRERIPAAYLTGVTWFAGHEIRVDERVLVPRSAPWVDAFVSEICGFTGVNDAHDDQVDALAAAYDALTIQGSSMGLMEYYRQQTAAKAAGGVAGK